MLFKLLAPVFIITCFLFSCSKQEAEPTNLSANTIPGFNPLPDPTGDTANVILVDASKDGGVWWFPQAGTFSADLPHQGKLLADYLRSLKFTVHELPRGATITWALLRNYKKIIRAAAFTNYSTQELAAYDSFFQQTSSLLLLSDHMLYTSNDGLSARLGLQFSGAYTGTLSPVTNHAITTGVGGLPYIAGSVILQPDPALMTILGYATTTAQGPAYAAMGILHHPRTRVFFLGDANGIEQLPQPFTENLVRWLFR